MVPVGDGCMHCSFLYFPSVPLPSILGKRRRVRATSVKGSKPAIMCLPKTYPATCRDNITVPQKKRSVFASEGLIGKIHLESD